VPEALLDDRYCITGNEEESLETAGMGFALQDQVAARATVCRNMIIYVLGTRGFPDVQGGIERHCERLYPRLVNERCDVTVFTRTPYIPKAKRLKEWHGVRFMHLWSPRNKYLEAIVHTLLGLMIARLHSPDFVHIHAIGPALLAPLARLLGLRVIMTHHGPDYQRQKWGCCARFLLKLGEWMGLCCARYVIVISQHVKTYLMNRYKRSDIAFIPNGVDRATCEPGKSYLDTFHLKADHYVLAVGRFVPEKGLHDLITAYDRLNHRDDKLVIVGGADHTTRYSRQLEAMASKNADIVLAGIRTHEELQCLYRYARVFVLPSYYEGLPITLLEALYFESPVVISDIPATREVALDEDAYFPPGDIDALVVKLKSAINEPCPAEKRRRYKQLVMDVYNWDSIAHDTCAFLSNAMM
jgi:glycosyltransferase involved in cell wall biosynthesis